MMGGMFTTLTGGALYVAGAIVLAVIGAATYLSSQGVLAGSDWLAIVSPILVGVVGVTSAHVAGQTVARAVNVPPPGSAPPPAPVATHTVPTNPGKVI